MSIGKSNANQIYKGRQGLKPLFMAFALLLSCVSPAALAQDTLSGSVTVYTDTYRPYVNPVGEVDGSAMRLVRMTLLNMKINPEFVHIDFGYGFHATEKSEESLSFPWLKTAEREQKVLYSDPIYSVRSQLFYNIRFHPDGIVPEEIDIKRFGRVTQYSYGEEIDEILNAADKDGRVTTYVSDFAAIQGLLNGEVNLLPQLSSVLTATLNASFSNQNQLIRNVPGISTLLPNYVVAPKTRRGKALIMAFNKSYDELINAGIINPVTMETGLANMIASDIGKIVASEGFPVVTGVSRTNPSETFAIPPGTRVIILDWSNRILNPSDADQLYKTMVDETLILVLNGPHIGKELRVKNMHLTIDR